MRVAMVSSSLDHTVGGCSSIQKVPGGLMILTFCGLVSLAWLCTWRVSLLEGQAAAYSFNLPTNFVRTSFSC